MNLVGRGCAPKGAGGGELGTICMQVRPDVLVLENGKRRTELLPFDPCPTKKKVWKCEHVLKGCCSNAKAS